jgi:hypothetical protein
MITNIRLRTESAKNKKKKCFDFHNDYSDKLTINLESIMELLDFEIEEI